MAESETQNLDEERPAELSPEMVKFSNRNRIQKLVETDGYHFSPIDININTTELIDLPALVWRHYTDPPKKMKITNTGETLILSAKWPGTRPYLCGGPLPGQYIFSQIHFHWGGTAMEGSEHTIEGCAMPLEMHAVHFKVDYNDQPTAMKYSDGIICLVYFFQIQSKHNSVVQHILGSIKAIRQANTSEAIKPFVITHLLYPFVEDYYLYWGRTSKTPILWMVTREVTGISFDQLKLFHKLRDINLQKILRNFRPIQPLNHRKVYHVLPLYKQTNSTLSPIPIRLDVVKEKRIDGYRAEHNECPEDGII